MLGLSDGERISMIRSAVLTQYMRVTDGQTDGIGVAYTRYSIYAVARKNQADHFEKFHFLMHPKPHPKNRLPCNRISTMFPIQA